MIHLIFGLRRVARHGKNHGNIDIDNIALLKFTKYRYYFILIPHYY